MPRTIVKLDGASGPRYLEWSSVVDAPVTFGMTREGFDAYCRHRYGSEGAQGLEERLVRCDTTGTSAHGETAASIISGNRAGPDECRLEADEIYRAYGLCQPIRGGWMPPGAEEEVRQGWRRKG